MKFKIMEINWIVLGVLTVVLIALILFIIKKNQKEKKKLTDLLNNDFKKSDEDEPDFDNVSER
jgi:preprotein translocase subunit YajC